MYILDFNSETDEDSDTIYQHNAKELQAAVSYQNLKSKTILPPLSLVFIIL